MDYAWAPVALMKLNNKRWDYCAEKNWPFSFQISSEVAVATSEQKNPSGSLVVHPCGGDFCGKAARTRRIRNSASICTDMMINADMLILPAMQPTHWQVNYSLSKSHFKQLLDEVFVISGIIKVEVSLNFLLGRWSESSRPFLLRCPRTWHCCPCTWHCSWKSCIVHATYL